MAKNLNNIRNQFVIHPFESHLKYMDWKHRVYIEMLQKHEDKIYDKQLSNYIRKEMKKSNKFTVDTHVSKNIKSANILEKVLVEQNNPDSITFVNKTLISFNYHFKVLTAIPHNSYIRKLLMKDYKTRIYAAENIPLIVRSLLHNVVKTKARIAMRKSSTGTNIVE